MKARIVFLLVLADIILIGLCAVSYISRDRNAPTLTIPSADLTYIEGGDNSGLLEGASASDEEDGDVSENIRIYNVSVMADGVHAQITYSVCDDSYNFTKKTKIVKYVKQPA